MDTQHDPLAPHDSATPGFDFGQRSPLLLAILSFVLAVGTTWMAWRGMQDLAVREAALEFNYQVRQTTRRIELRMATYQQVQRGVVGFLGGSLDVDDADFHYYITALDLQRDFPGIQGVALVRTLTRGQIPAHEQAVRRAHHPDYRVHPLGERPNYSSIIGIEPLTPMNRRALGFDMLSEPNRRAALERARDSGQPAASGKVRLIQEDGRDVQPGLVMYMPVYARGAPLTSVAQRRQALAGWVGAPFRMNDLMDGIGGERGSDIAFTIYDNDQRSTEAALFAAAVAASAQPRFAAERHIVIAGRPWLLEFRSSPHFEAGIDRTRARVVAIAGAGTSVLLALLVWTIVSGRRRALALAQRMTQQLRSSEFRWKYALEGAGDGVWDWDLGTGQAVYSRPFASMLGYSEDDIAPRVEAWSQLLARSDLPRATRHLREFLDGTAGTYSDELQMRCKDGSVKWILARAMAVARGADGRPTRVIGTHTDISHAKAGELALRDAYTRLSEEQQREAERTRALDEARNALAHAQKLEALGKLTGGVAHDFNNVLHVIGGNVQLLQMGAGPDNERLHQRLKTMDSAVRRGAKLAAQLLAFGRRQPLQPVAVDPVRLLHEVDDLLKQALGDKATLNLPPLRPGGNVLVDPNQLVNVLVNLAMNARDAMPDGGSLTITVEDHAHPGGGFGGPAELAAGDYMKIALSDTGSGMSREVLENAIEPFFTTKAVGEGTGLGLSMAYGFVKQSNGHLLLHSTPGVGTTVEIYLPWCDQPDQPVAAPDDDQEVLPSAIVLVVEDDADVRVTVVNLLSELGLQILSAADGAEALALLRGGARPDLLFTDVVMPGLVTSVELSEAARELVPGIAVLFTSGYTRDALVTGGRLQAGVNLLAKPYTRAELLRRVRELLAPRQPTPR